MKTYTSGPAELFASTSGIAKRAMRLFTVLAAGCLTISAQPGSPSTPSAASKKTQQQWLDSFAHLPMSFEANRGQTDPQVEFVSRGAGYTLFLTKNEAVFALNAPSNHKVQTTLRMRFEGTNPGSRPTGKNELAGKSNYFVGNDLTQWHTSIPTFAKVESRNLYPGVDLVYYGSQQLLEYDLRVAPGVDPAQIAIQFRADRTAGAGGDVAEVQVDALGRAAADLSHRSKPLQTA